MRADLTMTVEVTEDEMEVLKLASQGLTTKQIHERIGGKFSMRQLKRGLRFSRNLDLVRMTHDWEITWDFHEKVKPVEFPANFDRQVLGGS